MKALSDIADTIKAEVKKNCNCKKNETEKRDVKKALRNITETGLEYTEKAAEFIANKAHEASDRIKK